ncbi:Uncharacterised protein [Mycobacteroides abscessus subsp. abscessus]|nr:Uncharacterised protein [Mycobacteroides abscessus subsp. abscessus]
MTVTRTRAASGSTCRSRAATWSSRVCNTGSAEYSEPTTAQYSATSS